MLDVKIHKQKNHIKHTPFAFILVQATITLNLAQNATRRGKYIKPFRNQAIEEIRRLIVQEGYTE